MTVYDKLHCNEPLVGRRSFIKLVAGCAGYVITGVTPAFASPYRVGVGKNTDPYTATQRAVEASGEWPSANISGKTVIIKPNLVAPVSSETGITTDPQVVRALVDLSLANSARNVIIVEGGPSRAFFSGCGYDFFNTYDQRVSLIDLNDESVSLFNVPSGHIAYNMLFVPDIILDADTVFISVAKLKTHTHTLASLTMKNLIGLPPTERYSTPDINLKIGLHQRGIDQAVVDLNLVRPVDYAVVDGIWGMEGNGPALGEPVKADIVVAGKNPLAVDRVCLDITRLPQNGVMHLTYAARKGLGPKKLSDIDISGDPFSVRPFKWPNRLSPNLEYPRVFPNVFKPDTGQGVTIVYWVTSFPCLTRVKIVRASDISPEIIHIRNVRDWSQRPAGIDVLEWDGTDDNLNLVKPGPYCVQVEAKYSKNGISYYATGWVRVSAG